MIYVVQWYCDGWTLNIHRHTFFSSFLSLSTFSFDSFMNFYIFVVIVVIIGWAWAKRGKKIERLMNWKSQYTFHSRLRCDIVNSRSMCYWAYRGEFERIKQFHDKNKKCSFKTNEHIIFLKCFNRQSACCIQNKRMNHCIEFILNAGNTIYLSNVSTS